MSSIKISCLRTIIHVTFSFGTNCPKAFPLKHGLGGISPVAAYRSEQPGAVCQGCIAPPYIGGLPLTGGPGCAIFRRRGGGIGLNMNGGLLMNFTNSPYERMMKEIPHPEAPAPQKAPEGTPCAGCPYWRGIGCLFCYREHLKKQGRCVDI